MKLDSPSASHRGPNDSGTPLLSQPIFTEFNTGVMLLIPTLKNLKTMTRMDNFL